MRPYICISHASADADAAQRFLRELTRYGFRYEAPDESVPRREREAHKVQAVIRASDKVAPVFFDIHLSRLLQSFFCK